MSFEYFEKSDTHIAEKLIKEQGPDVCRNIISKHYINKYDFGYLSKSTVAQIGQTRSRRTSQNTRVTSFVLCKFHPEFDEIDISLICARPRSMHGKELIELVKQKAISLKCKYLSLLSIGDTKLVNWYKSQGFDIISEKEFPTGGVKAYYMKCLV